LLIWGPPGSGGPPPHNPLAAAPCPPIYFFTPPPPPPRKNSLVHHCVCGCDPEASVMRRSWSARGYCAWVKNRYVGPHKVDVVMGKKLFYSKWFDDTRMLAILLLHLRYVEDYWIRLWMFLNLVSMWSKVNVNPLTWSPCKILPLILKRFITHPAHSHDRTKYSTSVHTRW
jgi:hypothetical protein